MVTVLLTFSRALHIGSGLMLVTVVAFRWLILLPAFSESSEQEWTLFTPLFSRLNRIFVSAGIILVLSGMMLFWAAAAGMSGTSLEGSLDTGTLCTVAFQTQFGHVFLGRFALSILLGVITWHLVRTGWQARRQRSPLKCSPL
jgi:predicted PurR-regulated permease PerM